MNNVQNLFKQRDQAVARNDVVGFQATQLSDFLGSATDQYLSYDQLETRILAEADDVDNLIKVVFVKEKFVLADRRQHRFLLYSLVHTVAGWKISAVSAPFAFHRVAHSIVNSPRSKT